MMDRKPSAGRKTVIWNTRKKGGWDKYNNKTETNTRLFKASSLNDIDPEKLSNP